MTANITPHSKIVIVGAGCFGLSTAFHLLKRGFTAITILDRSPILPAPDAASSDLNKVVRSSYTDIFYTQLAREAIAEWKNQAEWGNCYHECGVVVAGKSQAPWVDKAYLHDASLGARIDVLATPDSLCDAFPSTAEVGGLAFPQGYTGYLNQDGGWAAASEAVSILLDRVVSLGATVHSSKSVIGLIKRDSDGQTCGVRCTDGSEYYADLVVLAAGSWMASAFPELELEHKCRATGQCIAFVELTPDEGEAYRRCPVYLDFWTGFYVFPPNKDNLVKFAIHAAGFTHTVAGRGNISTPRTVLSDGEDGLRIPKSAAKQLRDHLRSLYPILGDKPFKGTRICWYTDSPDDDWIIGYHPTDPGIMFATAGSGHAFKFLPVIGRLVADSIQGILTPDIAKKFEFNRSQATSDDANAFSLNRMGQKPQVLDLDAMCALGDLLP